MQHNLHYAQSELCSVNIQIKNLNVRISDFRVIIKIEMSKTHQKSPKGGE